ncbi:MAG: PP2C family serine/threonine-protein phosphatase, partial [Thermomonas sp.]
HRSGFTSAALPEQPEEALRAAFAATDGGILADAEEHSGATAACLLVLPDALVVGCVGDTHVVLSQGGKAHVPCVVHRPTLPCEVERVARAGGNVLNGRVCGVLAVSRALGDADLKLARADPQLRLTADVISAEPDVVRVPLSPDTECAILATDGLLDVVEPQLAVTFVRAQLAAHGNVQQAARALVDEALRRNSADNVSVVLVCFHQEPPEEASPCCSPRSNNNTT